MLELEGGGALFTRHQEHDATAKRLLAEEHGILRHADGQDVVSDEEEMIDFVHFFLSINIDV